jgi:hypothetical protein
MTERAKEVRVAAGLTDRLARRRHQGSFRKKFFISGTIGGFCFPLAPAVRTSAVLTQSPDLTMWHADRPATLGSRAPSRSAWG